MSTKERFIRSLNEKQKKLKLTVKNKWLKSFFNLPKINKEKTKKFVNFIYGLAKLDTPRIIYVKSPMQAQYILIISHFF